MPFDRFLIAPLNTGLQTDLRPFLVPDDAFTQLRNAYIFRGRLRKRFGSMLMGSSSDLTLGPLLSRLRVSLGTTNGSGNLSGTVPGVTTAGVIGQAFSIGSIIYTVNVPGTPATLLKTGTTTTATFNTSSGAYVFAGAPINTAVYFYPALPVMGICNYESGSINNFPTFAFDTQFVYNFSGSWMRMTAGTPIWHGSDSDFFWTANWQGISDVPIVLFATNFFVTNYDGAGAATDDPIWYYDGTTWTAATGNNAFYFIPTGSLHSGPFVVTSRIIVGFKNRLVLLNTVENDHSGGLGVNSNYVNRCRYSHNGSPFAANAWYEPNTTDGTNVADGAGYIDASTEEAIISAEFIKDRLIVYFESSTWELAYTQNEVLPFVWQKINTELGSEALQSSVPFDKVILTVGNVGIHACSGNGVERIDTKIPDQIFQIQDKSTGVERVAGIRDYYTEMVYWTFPSTQENPFAVYPNRVMVYNYRNNSWAFNDDCITAFGYFNQQPQETWASSAETWEEAGQTWDSGTIETQFRQILAGNQQGYIVIIDPDVYENATNMQISDMTNSSSGVILKIVNHNLTKNDYLIIRAANGTTGITNKIVRVVSVPTINTVLTDFISFTGTYTGGGTVARVSNYQIQSKQWNPYTDQGRNFYLARIDFAVLKTDEGEVTVDYSPSSTELSMLQQSESGALMGNGTLETHAYDPAYYPLEQYQERLWHPVYFQSVGNCIQILITMSDDQIKDLDIAFSNLEIDAMILHTEATSARLQS